VRAHGRALALRCRRWQQSRSQAPTTLSANTLNLRARSSRFGFVDFTSLRAFAAGDRGDHGGTGRAPRDRMSPGQSIITRFHRRVARRCAGYLSEAASCRLPDVMAQPDAEVSSRPQEFVSRLIEEMHGRENRRYQLISPERRQVV